MTGRNDYRTPRPLWNMLNEEFRFDIDATADSANALTHYYCSKAGRLGDDNGRCLGDALTFPWHTVARTAWLNPPYSEVPTNGRKRGEALIPKFLQKAVIEADRGCRVVAIVPNAQSEGWWQLCEMVREQRILTPRVNFCDENNRQVSGCTFGSAIVIFERGPCGRPVLRWLWNWRVALEQQVRWWMEGAISRQEAIADEETLG